MSITEKADQVVLQAKKLAATATSWTELSNEMFAQEDGCVAKMFPRMTERQAFYDMPQYEEVNQVFLEVIKRFGVADGAATKKSGKFVMRVPKTLHAALDVEARREGVSLNQLALSKLSIRLHDSAKLTDSLIVEAYKGVFDGYGSDRIIVHPEYNERYLHKCRQLGLTLSDYELNLSLQRIRKSGNSILPPASKKPRITDYDEFLFASEIAFRFLQIKEGVTLDRVLCDPQLRVKFDGIAKRLAPSQDEFKLRMGAFYLRKTHRLSPVNEVSNLDLSQLLPVGRVNELDLSSISDLPGMYVFYEDIRPMFAGETSRLRHRLQLHLKQAGNLFLPQWLELGCERDLELRMISVPKISHKDRLGWLNQFINKERPPFNYQAAA